MNQVFCLLLALNFITFGAGFLPGESKTEMLAGNKQKNWYIVGKTPDGIKACSLSSPHYQDNTWAFFADGSFEYNHGQLTEDPDCLGKDCCSDLVNLVGKWEFTNNEKGLRITSLYEQGKSANTFSVVLFDAVINQFEEGKLLLSQVDVESGQKYQFEFRLK